jgi:hypothetical protein
MKASTPSLILFLIASFLAIAFRLNEKEMLELYCRATIIPSLYIYYLVSNNYKISVYKMIILFLLFSRDILVLLKIDVTAMGSFSCVLFVYILLLYTAVKEFKYFLFRKKDIISVVLVIIGISTICYSVLNLKLENLVLDFSLYAFFGLVLSVLSIITILNYFKSGNHASFNALLMCICFIISDVFFMIFRFYFYNEVFDLISLITQFLSYFFMVKYFLEKDKISKGILV